MHSYVHDSLIPATVKSLGQAFDEDTTSNNNLEKIPWQQQQWNPIKEILGMDQSVPGICWMHVVGFRYQNRAKQYFVDGHEKATTLEYRPAYTKRYLDLEVQAHRWIQFSIDESKILEAQDYVAKETGYHYSTSSVDMGEYHVR